MDISTELANVHIWDKRVHKAKCSFSVEIIKLSQDFLRI